MAVRSLRFVLTGEDKSASRSLDRVGKRVDKLDSRIGSMAGAFAGGALAAGVVSFGKSSVAAFKEAERSQAEFSAAFAKFPKLADTNAKALGDYNSQLAKKTVYDDDAIASGQSVLAQFNLTGKQLKRVTPLLLDYAAKTGKDLPTAAKDLGRALLGNTRSLKEMGINYKSTGDTAKDFENIQRLLNEKVGGFAEREGKTAAGQAKILSNQYGEVQEQVGAKLVPALNKLGSELLSVIDFTERNSGVIKPLVVTIGAFATAVWGVNTATKAWKSTETAFLAVKGLFTTAVVAEGAAIGTTSTAVTGLAATEAAAGAAGAAGAVGVAAFATSVGTLAAAFGLLVASGFFAYKFGQFALNANDGGGDFAHQPLDPHQPGGSDNSGSSGVMIGPGVKPDRRFVIQPAVPTMPHGRDRMNARAMGGPIRAGMAYLTGEHGPEIITPTRSGYVHDARKTRSMFNPRARLDVSQVRDDRLMTQMLMAPLDPSYRSGVKYGHATPGMRDYITNVTKISLDSRPIGKSVTRTQQRHVRNGAKSTFGL